ncbi:MAG: TetR/AcrR family transcriptional regulator, partial [Pseudomonadota bacterium]
FDRDKVIDAAMHLLWDHGPGVLSINQLCSELGVSKPGLYREFGGEDALLAAALERYYTVRIEPLMTQLCQIRPLGITAAALADWLVAPSAFPAGCLFAKSRSVLKPLGVEATHRIQVMRTKQIEVLSAWLTTLQSAGEMRADLDPVLTARYVDTQITALLMLVARGEAEDSIRAQTALALAGLE